MGISMPIAFEAGWGLKSVSWLSLAGTRDILDAFLFSDVLVSAYYQVTHCL